MKSLPARPRACILSDVHRQNKRPFRVILDEAQAIKNTSSATHKDCFSIFRSATIMLSGTILDNKWIDIHGPIRLLSGHSLHAKSGKARSQTPLKQRWLQKLLLGITIIRPESILKLENMDVKDIYFKLSAMEKNSSDKHMNFYRRLETTNTRLRLDI